MLSCAVTKSNSLTLDTTLIKRYSDYFYCGYVFVSLHGPGLEAKRSRGDGCAQRSRTKQL